MTCVTEPYSFQEMKSTLKVFFNAATKTVVLSGIKTLNDLRLAADVTRVLSPEHIEIRATKKKRKKKK